MEKFILDTFAGNTFDGVAKEAQELTNKHKLVQFEFNGITCIVNKHTDLTLLYRDYSNSWTMDWKEVGPVCEKEYSKEVTAELQKRKLAAQQKAAIEQKEYEEQERKDKIKFNELVAGIELDIIPGLENDYKEYAAKNSNDGYSRAVIDYAEGWAKLMQIELAKGNKLKDIADATQKPVSFLGITGFQYGCVVQTLSHFWKHGEELRKWHNKEYGVSEDKKGVVNPAVLTISTK